MLEFIIILFYWFNFSATILHFISIFLKILVTFILNLYLLTPINNFSEDFFHCLFTFPFFDPFISNDV